MLPPTRALAEDAAETERCLGQAAALATELEDGDDRHPWLYWMSSADMQCKRAVSLGFLATAWGRSTLRTWPRCTSEPVTWDRRALWR